MASNITIEILDNAQNARITVPLSAIGATGVDSKANAAAIAEFMGHALEHSGIIGTLISSNNISNATVSNEHDYGDLDVVNADADTNGASSIVNFSVGKSITLYVENLGGIPIEYEASTYDTVASLKCKIRDKGGLFVRDQILYCNRVRMSNNKTLGEYGVTDGAVLRLHYSFPNRQGCKG